MKLYSDNDDRYLAFAVGLYYCGPFLAWTLQGYGILPKFYDIGFVFFCSAFLLFTYVVKNRLLNLGWAFPAAAIFSVYLAIVAIVAMVNSDYSVVLYLVLFFVFLLLYSSIIPIEPTYYLLLAVVLFPVLYFLNIDYNAVATGRVNMGDMDGASGVLAYCSLFGLAVVAYLARYNFGFMYVVFELCCLLVFMAVIFLTGVRSPLFGAVLMISIWMLRRLSSGKVRFLPIFIAISLILVSIYQVEIIRTRMDHLFNILVDGLFTIFSSSNDVFLDSSAGSRVIQRSEAVDIWSNNFWFGGGYKTFWVDSPLLQAFSDMGLFFGVLYLLVFLMVPMLSALFFLNRRGYGAVFSLYYIASLPRLFLHGQPYDWQHLVFLVPVLSAFSYLLYESNVVVKKRRIIE